MVSATSVSRYIFSASRYITSPSRYPPRYQSISSMYIRGLIPRIFAVLAEAVPIGFEGLARLHIFRVLVHILLTRCPLSARLCI